jgi:predicted dehydrogenase
MDAPTDDTVIINLKFQDGSIGTVHYFSNGSKAFPKERLEVFVAGRVLQLENYRKLTGFGFSDFKKMNLWKQDKGQKACVKASPIERLRVSSAASSDSGASSTHLILFIR